MSSFLDYLDNFEKKFECKNVIPEQHKPNTHVKNVVKENTAEPVKTKIIKVIKIIHKPIYIREGEPLPSHIMKENKSNIQKPKEERAVNRAANILDGIDDCGFDPGMPSSSRYYDNSPSSSNKNIKESSNILSKAASFMDDSSEVTSQPLRDIPEMNIDMLKFVPKEMLSPEQIQKVQLVESQKVEPAKQEEIPPEIQQMMEETRRMQQMFSSQNIDMSEVSHEFL